MPALHLRAPAETLAATLDILTLAGFTALPVDDGLRIDFDTAEAADAAINLIVDLGVAFTSIVVQGQDAVTDALAEALATDVAAPEAEAVEPVPSACILHLWGESPRDLVERGADIARGGLMGKVTAYQNPPTGFIGDHWTLRFTTTMLEDIGVVASEIPVSWALYVDGVWAAGTDAPADAGVVGSIESTDAAPVASGKKGSKRK